MNVMITMLMARFMLNDAPHMLEESQEMAKALNLANPTIKTMERETHYSGEMYYILVYLDGEFLGCDGHHVRESVKFLKQRILERIPRATFRVLHVVAKEV